MKEINRKMARKTRLMSVVFLTLVALLFFAAPAMAGPEQYRQCSDTQLCEIGEYLFDDDYTPIANATCTLFSRDPQENIFLNNVAMTANADGWYSYQVNAVGQDYGLYRSQICCTSGTEYICLDKSFEIATSSAQLTQNEIAGAVWDAQTTDHNTAGSFGENLQNPSSLTANDVWSHPQRTLTSFGTLVSDIWNYSTRSLNSFTSLIAGIWSNTDRTLTQSVSVDTNGLATSSQLDAVEGKVDTIINQENTTTTAINETSEDVSDLKREILTNRLYLEQLTNAPIIETVIESGSAPENLQTKILESKKMAKRLYGEVNSIGNQISDLNRNWNDSNYKIALDEISSASKVLGVTTQDSVNPDSINSQVSWFEQKWKSPVISNLSVQTASALSNVNGMNREIKSYGKTFISQQYLGIAEDHLTNLQDLVGNENDSSNSDTLFGYIANIERISEILVNQSLELDEIFEQWHQLSNGEKDLKLARIKDTILEVNHISDAELLLKKKTDDENHRENLALSLKGLIDSNLTYLANASDVVTQATWLEFGSVVFRTLISNPSALISQEVNVKYYLPEEVSMEHIIKTEEGVQLSFDSEKNALFVFGKYQLKPEETKTIMVEVADVWILPQDEIDSIRKQTDLLFDSLKNTTFFAQGSILKSDIDVKLDRIEALNNTTQTPELKIKSYREAILEMQAAKANLETLKTLVSSAGSLSTVFGFVGGVQAIAVWGLVIILVAGFVFLLIYLRMISNKDQANPTVKTTKSSKSSGSKKDPSFFSLIKEILVMKTSSSGKSFKLPILFIVIFGLSLIVFLLLQKRESIAIDLLSPVPNYELINSKKPEERFLAQAQPTTGMILGAGTDIEPSTNQQLKTLVRANIPEGFQAINVRSKPEKDSVLTGRLYINQDVYMTQKKDGWVLIETKNSIDEKPVMGWILENLIREIE